MPRARPLQVDDERRGGIGGASGDAGVEHRRAVAAYAVAHGLTNVPLQGFGVAAPFAQVSAVCLETDDPVDDVRIEFVSGGDMTDDESTRLFVEAHRWAYDSAITLPMTAVDPIKLGVVGVPA